MGSPMKAGARYRSSACATEVVVVRGSGADADLRCGGRPMVPVGEPGGDASVLAPFDDGTQLGKRYTTADDAIELLCTKGGDGSLSIGDEALAVKGAKPLPSSD